MPDGLRITASHLWFTDIDRLAVNDKDFSLTLEMMMRESLMSLSLLVLNHQSPVTSPSHLTHARGSRDRTDRGCEIR